MMNRYSICLVDGDSCGTWFDFNPTLRLPNKNEVLMYKMLNSVSDIDIIFIDDIHLLSSGCLEAIKDKPVVSTFNGKDGDIITIDINFDDVQIFKLLDGKTIQYDGNIINISDFLNQIKRDLKIKSILNE